MFADAKCAHIYRKKTKSEEDEHTHTIEKERKNGVAAVEHDSSLFSTFF